MFNNLLLQRKTTIRSFTEERTNKLQILFKQNVFSISPMDRLLCLIYFFWNLIVKFNICYKTVLSWIKISDLLDPSLNLTVSSLLERLSFLQSASLSFILKLLCFRFEFFFIEISLLFSAFFISNKSIKIVIFLSFRIINLF